MQQIYWYVTAVLAAKFGVQLHAVQVMSTHIHEVITDVRGVLPAFLRERNRILANVLKVHRNWPEEVFQRAPPSCVELHGAEAVASKIAYTLANCVEAGLVAHPAQWPGVTVRAEDIGNRIVQAERPAMYFDPENPIWPLQAEIEIVMPEALLTAYGASASKVLCDIVATVVDRARRAARKAGRTAWKSARQLCEIPFTRTASSYEPTGGRDPTFATAGSRKRMGEAVVRRRAFLTAYRKALDALKTGVSGVRFPEGTWRWVRELGHALSSRMQVAACLRTTA